MKVTLVVFISRHVIVSLSFCMLLQWCTDLYLVCCQGLFGTSCNSFFFIQRTFLLGGMKEREKK